MKLNLLSGLNRLEAKARGFFNLPGGPQGKALEAAKKYLAAQPRSTLEIIDDPSGLTGLYLPEGHRLEDYYFFWVKEKDLKVGSSRVLCVRKKDFRVVFDGFCGE